MAGFEDRLAVILAAPHVRGLLAEPGCVVLVSSNQGKLLWASPSFPAVSGRPVGDLIQTNLLDRLLPEHAVTIMRLPLPSVPSGQALIQVRLPICFQDGAYEWYSFDAFRALGLYVAAMRRTPAPKDGRVAPVVMPLAHALV